VELAKNARFFSMKDQEEFWEDASGEVHLRKYLKYISFRAPSSHKLPIDPTVDVERKDVLAPKSGQQQLHKQNYSASQIA